MLIREIRRPTELIRLGLILFAFALPVSLALLNLSLGLLLLGWLLAGGALRIPERLRHFPLLLLPLALLLSDALSGLWSADRGAWLGQLSTDLMFLVPPLAAAELGLQGEGRLIRQLQNVFMLSVLLAFSSLLGYAAWQFFASGAQDRSLFYYETLTLPLGLHPSYLGMMVNLSAVWAALRSAEARSQGQRAAWGLALAACGPAIVLLGSRTQLVIWVLFALAGILLRMLESGNRQLLFAGLLLLGVVASLLLSSDASRQRLSDLARASASAEVPVQELPWSGTAVRRYIWGQSGELLQAHWLGGVGAGDVQPELARAYAQDGFPRPQMNAHNQYLQTALASGLPGLSLLLVALCVPVALAFRARRWDLCCLTALWGLSALTESLLERQWGAGLLGLCFVILVCAGMGTGGWRKA
jgi:O-antigen ligase